MMAVGELIEVLETVRVESLQQRVRFAHGRPFVMSWCSVSSAGGKVFLEAVHEDLPPGWSEHMSQSTGKKYYWNEETDERTYDRPIYSQTKQPKVDIEHLLMELIAKADVLQSSGDQEKAIIVYSEALNVENVEAADRAELLNRRGRCKLILGNFTEAIADFTEGLEAAERGSLFLHRCEAHFHLKQIEESKQDLLKAWKLIPENECVQEYMRELGVDPPSPPQAAPRASSPRGSRRASPRASSPMRKQLSQVDHMIHMEGSADVIEMLRQAIRAQWKVQGTALSDVRALFEAFDASSTGTVSSDSFKLSMRRLGVALSDSQVAEAINRMDPHDTGLVYYEDFLSALKEKSSPSPGAARASRASSPTRSRKIIREPPASVLEDAFERFDFERNGYLSFAEVERSVNEVWPDFKQTTILLHAYRAADANGDGYIQKPLFLKMISYIVYFHSVWPQLMALGFDSGSELTLEQFKDSASVLCTGEQRSLQFPSSTVLGFNEFCTWLAHTNVGHPPIVQTEEQVPAEATVGAPKCASRIGSYGTRAIAKRHSRFEKFESQSRSVFQEIGRAIRAKRHVHGTALSSVEATFDLFDTDKNGALSYEEFRQALKRLGLGVTDAQVEEVIRVVDSEGSGEMHYEDFVRHLNGARAQSPARSPRGATTATSPRRNRAQSPGRPPVQAARAAWTNLDGRSEPPSTPDASEPDPSVRSSPTQRRGASSGTSKATLNRLSVSNRPRGHLSPVRRRGATSQARSDAGAMKKAVTKQRRPRPAPRAETRPASASPVPTTTTKQTDMKTDSETESESDEEERR